MTNVASIGKSLLIKGELTGNEDLTIEGRVEGKINLNGYSVTIGQSGLVMAEVQAKTVVVCGQVKGDVTATGNVEVAATGTVLGNVTAPRVVMADGAQFKGSIDMGSSASGKPGASQSQNQSQGHGQSHGQSASQATSQNPTPAGARS